MYKIKVDISVTPLLKKATFEGIFVSKGEKCSGKVIRQQVARFVEDNLIASSGVKREDVFTKVSYSKLPDDIVVVEDKPYQYENKERC